MSYLTKSDLRIQFKGKTITINNSSTSNIPEVTIGTQTWMLYNVDVDLPGSRVYDDDENNRLLYGGLYTFNMRNDIVTAYPGYRFPLASEYQTLIDYLGGSTVAGGKMKEIGSTYWGAGNTESDNSSGFSARGGGRYNTPMESYDYLNEYGLYMCLSETTSDLNILLLTSSTSEAIIDTGSYWAINTEYQSVRLIKI